jgi:hypothetical protein
MADLIIRNSDGHVAAGIDPRSLSVDDLNAHFEYMPPLKAIRAKCMDCCAGKMAEVRKCTAVKCPLWPFRMRKNPWRKRRAKHVDLIAA